MTGGETGLLVSCGDYEALAANVIRLLEDQRLAAELIRSRSHRVPTIHMGGGARIVAENLGVGKWLEAGADWKGL